MPEGDTIYRAARELAAALEGKEIRGARAAVPGLDAERLAGRTVARVESRGKSLLVHLDDGSAIHTHMRMEGVWRVHAPPESPALARQASASPRGARLVLDVGDAVAVCYAAPVVELLSAWKLRHHAPLARLGPDLLGPAFDAGRARANLRARGELEIGEALLAQSALAGIGNVYKSEVLFVERVSPFARVSELDDATLDRLVARARRLLAQNVGRGPRRTRSGEGPRVWVYGRSGERCLVCGGFVSLRRQGALARSTYFCAACQGPG